MIKTTTLSGAEDLWRFDSIAEFVKHHGNSEIINWANILKIEVENSCTECGKACFEELYPQIVFRDTHHCICEECSIDYEQSYDGAVSLRPEIQEWVDIHC